MKKALRFFPYILVLLLGANLFTACFDDEEIDYTSYNDLIISNIAFGTLPRTMVTTNKAGGDSTYYSTISASNAYPFTIDQLNNVAYNLDSLPYGTQADKIIFSVLTANGGTIALRKLTADEDTLYSTADTLDFSRGYREFNLYGSDGTSRRSYRVEARIHRQKPDSLDWNLYAAADWDAQALNCGHTAAEYSVAGCSFRIGDGLLQVLNAESGEYTADKMDDEEASFLPTSDFAWISAPSRVSKSITEVLLYGTRVQADTLAGVLWRRNIDSDGIIQTAWEYLTPTFGSLYSVPAVHHATLLPYDQGYLLVGLLDDESICLKYSIDRGRTWKEHSYLVLSKELKVKRVKTLQAGVDAHSNLWLLLDDNELWRGRAHSVDWQTDRRIFED